MTIERIDVAACPRLEERDAVQVCFSFLATNISSLILYISPAQARQLAIDLVSAAEQFEKAQRGAAQ